MKQLTLFWCSTPGGDEDYFVVSPSAALAVAYFSQEHGFELDDIKAEALMFVPMGDRPLLDVNIPDPSDLPRTPCMRVLERWGFTFNETFHVFYRGERIFRPEGVVRTFMRANAHDTARQRKALIKTS